MPTLWEKAKEKLTEEFKAGRIEDDWKPSYVHTLDPLYQAVNKENFVNNFRELRKRMRKYKHFAEYDDEALRNDRIIHPIDFEGRWAGSEAEKMLKLDMKDEKHKEMKPSELWNSREEFKSFTKDQFRKHIYQEERNGKESMYWLVVKEEKKKKKDDKAARKDARRILIEADPLQGLTVAQLKQKLRELHLKVGGKKQDLIQRIKDHEKQHHEAHI